MIDVAIPIGQYVGMWKSQFQSLVLGVALSLAPVFAGAAGVYTGTAPVATQSDQDRAAALRAALSQAVTQAAKGDASVLRRPDIARALTRPERYARQYSYQANTAPAEPGKAAAKYLLVAQFDGAQIDALVRDQGPAAAAAGASPSTSNAPTPSNAPNTPPAAAGAGTPAATPNATADGGTATAADGSVAAASYRLWFSGLRSAEDYARLVGALNTNSEVRAFRIEQAHGNVLQARIDVRSSLQNLTDSLNSTRVAHSTNTKPPVDGVDAVLDFEP